MLRAYTAAQVRAAEQPLLAAGEPLMLQAAGAAASEVLRELRRRGRRIPGTRVLVLVGSGNNGADALYAAAGLARRSLAVTAALLGPCHKEAEAAARAAGVQFMHAQSGADPEEAGSQGVSEDVCACAREADVWIDGILGIGARLPVRSQVAQLLSALFEVRAARAVEPVSVALDVPSGIGVDDGACSGPVFEADITVTMGAFKPGLLLDPARRYVGRLVDVPLGLEAFLPPRPALASLTDADVADMWPVPGPDSHKYTRGVVGLDTGSMEYPGAGILSVRSALAAGPGMVRYGGPREIGNLILPLHPEVVLGEGRVQSWVLGSGIPSGSITRCESRLRLVAESGVPVVVDAGATLLAARGGLPDRTVLTPHAGELAALFRALGSPMSRDEIESAPRDAARRAAELTGAIVLLKGSSDTVCAPDGTLFTQAGAPGWRGVAGSGDVLAGLTGAALAIAQAQAEQEGRALTVGELTQWVAAATYLHGRAALRASGSAPGRPITASDIVAHIPAAIYHALRSEDVS
ncbi:bifunctional ADP-dependent NAD(P)H-hydrate dehydratase/NAD(P)H-hydrate epimerase [Arcanobacterium haemolyticum]|nr:bifunctional ADP-dependent NAD(P)H-hydrate dehydratase/NAD(P)H-hydrate epimerase [Arcanobacterium haemolyticum]